ncbi:MAG: FAD binding domain-containing protein [Alphaproteobacteria bacterium]|jgi:CO/xanthine dehydrogenase FAD-binding subunit|nr:FAD binding domain-containing protein [Alphaproteobacteria bacterium]
MKPVAFDYCRPESVEEATALLHELGGDAVLLAGGMSLGPMLNMRLVRPSVIVDINRIEGLDRIVLNDSVVIGAMARQGDVMADVNLLGEVPLLEAVLPHVGHFQTRNRGTFGGSVGHADPSAEIPLALVTLGGTVELTARRGVRRVPAAEFFHGVLTTARRADEMITALHWPRRRRRSGYAFEEVAQRHGDFAIAAVACMASLGEGGELAELRLAFGGVEDRPILADTSSFIGAPADGASAAEIAAKVADGLEPMEDIAASADYRRALARTLGLSVLERAFEQAAGS